LVRSGDEAVERDRDIEDQICHYARALAFARSALWARFAA
jgi:hypothetical protein